MISTERLLIEGREMRGHSCTELRTRNASGLTAPRRGVLWRRSHTMLMTRTKPEYGFAAKRNVAAILWVALMAAVPGFEATAAGDNEQSTTAGIAKMKESKISLAEGLRESGKQNGTAISATFEIQGRAPYLSV